MRHYIAVLIPERRSGWSVLFPDFPGCVTQGESLDEAIAMAADALAGHIAVARDYGDPIPEPRSLDEIKADKKWVQENGVNWGAAMATPVLARPPLGKPERVTVSIDSNILRAIDSYAKERDQTRSAVLTAGAEILMGLPVEHMANETLAMLAKMPKSADDITDEKLRRRSDTGELIAPDAIRTTSRKKTKA